MGLFAKMNGFRFDPASQAGLTVKLQCAVNVRANDRKQAAPRSYDCWVIDCLAVGGAGFSWTEHSGWLPRLPGVAHLYRPGVIFADDNTREIEAHESSYILFEGGEQLGLEALTGLDGFARIYDPELEIYRRMAVIGRLGEARGNQGILAVQGLFYELIDYLLNHAEPAGGYEWRVTGDAADPARLGNKLRSYLEQHYRRKLRLEKIARDLGISESTLSHRCRAETGQGVMALLNTIRIEQSIPLLQRGMLLKEIAHITGFTDEFHYSKAFKRHLGCSPRHYKS